MFVCYVGSSKGDLFFFLVFGSRSSFFGSAWSDVQNQSIHRGILIIELLGAVTPPEQSLDSPC